MSNFKTPEIQPNMHGDAIATPNCPLCGSRTLLAPMHKAVEAVVNVFRCTACDVLYPVTKKRGDGV